MPANVGEMFYYGPVPWHGQGRELDQPANMEEAIEAGGLDWEVEAVGLSTDEEPPSPVRTRFAMVRKDRSRGHPGRVLGVAHKEFNPLQNREGIRIFDSVFGKGKRVYHTGGYLGSGEVIWLLAELPKNIFVTPGDRVNTYALFTNSHNGTIAVDFRLTTVRVVCRNTLCLALKGSNTRDVFKHSHQGDYSELEEKVAAFFAETLRAVGEVETRFKAMLDRKFDDDLIKAYIESIFPVPAKPAKFDTSPMLAKLYTARVKKVKAARVTTAGLMNAGKGTDLPGVKGSLWGALNAVLEYADHYDRNGGTNIASGLFGSGALLKRKAFDLALKCLFL
jgi:phage/plasmid-like protein (TIGR03299 family)